MRKTCRRSLLSFAVMQAIGTGMAAPSVVLANESEQPSATAAFAQTRDLQRELIELKNAVIESPEDPSLRFQLGKLYLRIGDAASAEKELRRARDLGLDDYELLLALGEVWIAQGDFRRVITDDALLDAQDAEQRAALETLQGQALLVQGRTDEARDHFSEALIQVEDYGPAWLAMAESHLADDDVVAAQQAMSRARIADLDPAELLRVEANIAFKFERFEEAADFYRRALGQRNGDPVLLRGLAVSQLRQGQPEQASDTLDRLLVLSANSSDVITLKAQAALLLQDYRTAAKLAGAMVGLGDDEARVAPLFIAGAASLFNGGPQQAREYLARYLARRPDDTYARRLLGQALLQLDMSSDAYEVLKPLADDAGDDVRLLTGLAIAAAGAGAMGDATAYLRRAVELAPDNEGLKARLAAVQVATDDRIRGLEQLDRLAQQDDGYALLALDASINRLTQGELEAAAATARKVKAMAPNALEPLLVEGIALVRAGQLDAAEAAFAEILKQQPDNVAARTGMAEIQLRRGDTETALAAFRQLAADRPSGTTMRVNLAAAELQAGRALKAQQRLQEVLADHPESTAARVALANSYLADALPRQALDVLRDVRAAEDPSILLTTARAELMADRPGDAVARLEQLVSKQPGSVAARLALAQALERNAQGSLARGALEAAIRMAPEQRDARYALLRHLLLQPGLPRDELDQAVDDAVRFIDEEPTDIRGQVLRSLVLFRMDGQRDLALENLGRVYTALPSAQLGALLANLYMVDRRVEDATRVLAAYVSDHPEDTYARVRLAHAQLNAGDFVQAAENLMQAMEQGSRREGLALTTAWALAQTGRTAEARGYLRQAEAQGGAGAALPNPMLPHARGLIRLQSGDAPGAVASLREAMKQTAAPSVRLRLDLAKALFAVGDRGDARDLLNALESAQLSPAERIEWAELKGQLP